MTQRKPLHEQKGRIMKIITIEEHAIDLEIVKGAQPALQHEAPYIGLQSSLPRPRHANRPSAVTMKEAIELGTDLGEGRIRHMDEHGIQMQVLSWVSPAQLAPADQVLQLTRAANDRLSAAVAVNPARLSGLAVLPWQNPSAAADELTRSVNELGLKGALIVGRPGDAFLDDPRYAPVLKRLNDLQVPLYVHPFNPLPQVYDAYYSGFSPLVSAEFALGAWGWHNEAGIHVLRLILSGIFEKFPDLQVISGHWGEMVPFYLERLDDVLTPAATGLSGTIAETYRRHVWVTPSGMYGLPHFEFIHKVIGADRIIWSVDYPFLTLDGTRKFIDELPVSQDDKEKMTHLNAEKLFRL
jgi:predicted TIM-barrel fold metal-dependent hydrolase